MGLSWDCVDYDRCTHFVNKQLQKTKKVGGEYVLTTTKNSRNRIIAVAPTVMEMLKRQQMLQHEMQIAAGVAWANKWKKHCGLSSSIGILSLLKIAKSSSIVLIFFG